MDNNCLPNIHPGEILRLVEDSVSLATVVRASCPRRLEACPTNGRYIYA
jgi:hypothetical protein